MRTTRRRLTAGLLGTTMLAAALGVSILQGSSPAAAAVPGDGTTQATAGASCWGIKQQAPTSPDGLYWLVTAALGAPQQFYCDMTTNGGGWVLVGRGRQGWTFAPNGQGSPSTLRSTTTGTGAFTPAALPGPTIDALMDGAKMRDLPDGVRVRRATNQAGTSWQEWRLKIKDQGEWSWGFGGGLLLTSASVDGTSYAGSNTRDTSVSYGGQTTNQLSGKQGTLRLWTYPWQSHNWQPGFSMGTGITGSSSSTSYLWQYGSEGNPIGFSQVWIRPQVPNSAVPSTPIPAGGFAAQTVAPELKTKAEPNPWGVTGNDRTNDQSSVAPYVNVFAVKPVGDRVYVGGRFTTVRNAAGTESYPQKFLAAFDRKTGNWISSFRPTLDGRVYDIDVTADGKLLVAGDFTNVNGASGTAALAALDPTTGNVLPQSTWKTVLTRSDSGGTRPIIRTLAIGSDGWVYAGGRVTGLTGGTWGAIKVSGLIKVSATNGTPASGFGPVVPAAPADIAVAPENDRIYVAGSFNNVSGNTNMGYFAVLSAATGAPVSGIGPYLPSTTNAKFQQTVGTYDGRLYIGGSEHTLQMYNHDRTQRLGTHITRNGGDFQAMTFLDGKLYATCHCVNWDYEGADNYSAPAGYSSVEPMNIIGRYDAGTLAHEGNWYPTGIRGATDNGMWALAGDADHCLWFGGDLERIGGSNTPADWAGGFGRFCQDDATAPSTPQNVSGSLSGTTATIKWSASTDNGTGALQYWVYRDDKVIATTFSTSITDANLTGNHRYAVRAVDPKGNKSASLAPITVSLPPANLGTLVAKGATWKYLDTGADQGTAWSQPGFNDAGWASGAAVLGWGKSQTTTIGATRPVTTYFRSTFQVADASQVRTLSLGALVDDGAIVYVNGKEVARVLMPNGAVTGSTLASGYTSGSQETTYRPFTIPGSFLTNGTNTIAVEVHQAQTNNADAIFDLELKANAASGDSTAPSAPALTATGGQNVAQLSWTAATDDGVVAGYGIKRDGALVAYVPAGSTTWTDSGLAGGASHTWQVVAYDANANGTGSNVASASITNPPAPLGTLVAKGASWSYLDTGVDPGTTWKDQGFDASSWKTGLAVLGWGKSPTTEIGPSHPVTTYFRKTFSVADPSGAVNLQLGARVDDGAVIYLNGTEVARVLMPDGTPTASTLASGYTSGSQETTYRSFTIPASLLVPGTNTIAVEVHQAQVNNADAIFDLELKD